MLRALVCVTVAVVALSASACRYGRCGGAVVGGKEAPAIRLRIDRYLEYDSVFRAENGFDDMGAVSCHHRYLARNLANDRFYVDAECVQERGAGMRAPVVVRFDVHDEPVMARAASERGTANELERLFPCAAAKAARASAGKPLDT